MGNEMGADEGQSRNNGRKGGSIEHFDMRRYNNSILFHHVYLTQESLMPPINRVFFLTLLFHV